MAELKLDRTRAKKATICFGSGLPLSSIDIIQVLTPVGTTNFYIIDIHTLFFPRFKDINIPSIYLNNIIN